MTETIEKAIREALPQMAGEELWCELSRLKELEATVTDLREKLKESEIRYHDAQERADYSYALKEREEAVTKREHAVDIAEARTAGEAAGHAIVRDVLASIVKAPSVRRDIMDGHSTEG